MARESGLMVRSFFPWSPDEGIAKGLRRQRRGQPQAEAIGKDDCDAVDLDLKEGQDVDQSRTLWKSIPRFSYG